MLLADDFARLGVSARFRPFRKTATRATVQIANKALPSADEHAFVVHEGIGLCGNDALNSLMRRVDDDVAF